MGLRKLAIHYYRLIPETTITYTAGGSDVITTGWYSLPSFLAAIEAHGVVTMTWTQSTNRVAASAAFAMDAAAADSLLGWPDAGGKDGTANPGATWSPLSVEYMQEYAPIDVAGKRAYDTDFYTAQNGRTWALGSVTTHRERFTLRLVNKFDMFDGLTGGVTEPFIDAVYRPDLGICFELYWANSVDWATAYTGGETWCHTALPESAMQMPPWDQYYTMTIEANRYDLP
jgi:hypothetical protein